MLRNLLSKKVLIGVLVCVLVVIGNQLSAPVEVFEMEVPADGRGVPVMHTMPVVTEPINIEITAATPKILLHRHKVWRE